MCDTVVIPATASADGATWLAKNSDRAPNEAQNVLHRPASTHAEGRAVRCTWLELPEVARTAEVALSCPQWMWGAEMGVNAHGVAIGNEAVFTRLPVPDIGLTGMDLVRLALERSTSAIDALELMTDLLDHFGQGGPCTPDDSMRYHNAFLIADRSEAWVLETADRFWVAERVRSPRGISNALSIGKRFDRISDAAIPFARAQGWCRGPSDFDFAASFGDPLYRQATGGVLRRARTERCAARAGRADGFEAMTSTLRDHADSHPAEGWRMHMPCAHASWQPTRHHGQTTGSMIARLAADGPQAWFTGTSSPCLSVFKPIVFGGSLIDTGPSAGPLADASLWWRHERLHRLVLDDYDRRAASFAGERSALEARARLATDTHVAQTLWDAHAAAIPRWTHAVEAMAPAPTERRLFRAFWATQSRRARLTT